MNPALPYFIRQLMTYGVCTKAQRSSSNELVADLAGGSLDAPDILPGGSTMRDDENDQSLPTAAWR